MIAQRTVFQKPPPDEDGAQSILRDNESLSTDCGGVAAESGSTLELAVVTFVGIAGNSRQINDYAIRCSRR